MKIEFYSKTTGEVVNHIGWFFVDEDGDVHEYDCGEITSCESLTWRIV